MKRTRFEPRFQWFYNIEDQLIEWGFKLCIGAMFVICLYILVIGLSTLPRALRAFGFIS